MQVVKGLTRLYHGNAATSLNYSVERKNGPYYSEENWSFYVLIFEIAQQNINFQHPQSSEIDIELVRHVLV